MNIRERIESILEHYDYAIIKTTGHEFDNVLVVDNATPQQLKRFLSIVFGERLTKVKGGFKVTHSIISSKDGK